VAGEAKPLSLSLALEEKLPQHFRAPRHSFSRRHHWLRPGMVPCEDRLAPLIAKSDYQIYIIHIMDIHSIDLDLLVVLDSVMQTGSVTRAAQRLHLSQ
jgi:hypothetical protein